LSWLLTEVNDIHVNVLGPLARAKKN
jgi:hypothetical protein